MINFYKIFDYLLKKVIEPVVLYPSTLDAAAEHMSGNVEWVATAKT